MKKLTMLLSVCLTAALFTFAMALYGPRLDIHVGGEDAMWVRGEYTSVDLRLARGAEPVIRYPALIARMQEGDFSRQAYRIVCPVKSLEWPLDRFRRWRRKHRPGAGSRRRARLVVEGFITALPGMGSVEEVVVNEEAVTSEAAPLMIHADQKREPATAG